jgi:ERCC4-related helicase
MIVHSLRPDWGHGRVVAVSTDRVEVAFEAEAPFVRQFERKRAFLNVVFPSTRETQHGVKSSDPESRSTQIESSSVAARDGAAQGEAPKGENDSPSKNKPGSGMELLKPVRLSILPDSFSGLGAKPTELDAEVPVRADVDFARFFQEAKPARSPDEYVLHLAAHEWDFEDPLSIRSKDDFLCIPELKFSLFAHQVEGAITFFRHLAPKGMIADDVGLGKTITAGLIIMELIKRKRVSSFLVVCPKALLTQWQSELQTKFNIKAEVSIGAELKENLHHPRIITTYESARNSMEKLAERGFDLVVMDEAHKLRNLCGPKQPAKVAELFRDFMRDRCCTYALMLSATPIQTRLWDIYSLVEILKVPQPNPLGDEHFFVSTFIADDATRARRLNPDRRIEFRQRLGQAVCRKNRSEVSLVFPERRVLQKILAPTPEERLYEEECLKLLRSMNANPLEQSTFVRSVLSSPWAAAKSLRKKTIYFSSHEEKRFLLELADRGEAIRESAKSDAVVKLVRKVMAEDPNWRILIFTERLETQEFLRRVLGTHGLGDQVSLYQGGQDTMNRRALQDFGVVAENKENRREYPAKRRILISTDAGAEGLNLQVCNMLVNYDLPWNPMKIEQRIGRVQRLGQEQRYVTIMNLVLGGTVEERIVARCLERLEMFKMALGSMEEILSLAGDEDGNSFERSLLELVKAAIQGKDIERDMEAKLKSIEEAKRRYEELLKATRDDLAGIAPTDCLEPPKFDPVPPRVDLKEFIEQALMRTGYEINWKTGTRFDAIDENDRRKRFTIDPADLEKEQGEVLLGKSTLALLARGSRELGSIIDQWKNLAHSDVVNTMGMTTRKAADIVREKLTGLGYEVVAANVKASESAASVQAAAVLEEKVYHDRIQLVHCAQVENRDGIPGSRKELQERFPGEFKTERRETLDKLSRFLALPEEIEETVQKALRRDPQLAAFAEYYLKRRDLELARLIETKTGQSVRGRPRRYLLMNALAIAERDPVYRAGVEDIHLRFLPHVSWKLIGIEGCIYEKAEVATIVRRPGTSLPVDLVLKVIPLSQEIVEGLEFITLKDGRRAFAQETEVCAKSGERGLKVEMVESAVSRKWFFPSYAGACEASGKPALPEELEKCAETGKRVLPELLCRSDYSRRFVLIQLLRTSESGSGRRGTESELDTCMETRKRVLLDELATCSVSGAKVMRSILQKSEYSGQQALPRFMAKSDCEPGRRLALESELVTSAVSGKRGLPDEMEETRSGKLGFRSELVQSSVSGAWLLPAEAVKCAVTGELAAPSELIQCEETGERVLPSELDTCSVSGKKALRRLLEQSEFSFKKALSRFTAKSDVGPAHRRALRNELLTSSISGKQGLRDEVETTMTGKLALREELVRSAASGGWLAPDEVEYCSETGKPAGKSELVQCCLSQKRVLPELIKRSDVSGRRALERFFLRSALPPFRQGLEDEFVQCQATKRQVLKDEVKNSEISGRPAVSDEMRQCSATGKWILPDEGLTSAVSGRFLQSTLCDHCHQCQKMVAKSELETCSTCQQICCKACIPSGECKACQQLRDAPLIDSVQANLKIKGIGSLYPAAKQWKVVPAADAARVVGIPSAINLFAKRRLFVLKRANVTSPPLEVLFEGLWRNK